MRLPADQAPAIAPAPLADRKSVDDRDLSIERAVAEITARQRALAGEACDRACAERAAAHCAGTGIDPAITDTDF